MFRPLDAQLPTCGRKCTAGQSFFIIDVNGRVARCWFRKNECCGSVETGQFSSWTTLDCDDRKCAPSCEPAYNTIWEDGGLPQQGVYVPYDDSMFTPQRDHAFFQIILCNACNYACPYCVAGSNYVPIAKDRKSWLTTQQWIDWWKMIGKRFKTVSVTIVGGEPTIFPGFGEIAHEISQLDPNGHHRLFTNCSLPKPLEPFTSGRIKNFEVYAALHPTNVGFDLARFTNTFLQIREHMPTVLVMVDTLDNLPFKAELTNHFGSLGIELCLLNDEVKTKEANKKDCQARGLAK